MDIVINLVGGLGLFLFGMSYMGDGLQKAAGNRLKSLLAVLTKNKFMGLMVGTLVTAVIQSSSATTVMTVGFVNAGLMNLDQAIGIIMGANIGTTVTAFLVALNITKAATLLVGLGVFVYIASTNKKIKDVSQIVIGFGILFIGMDLMKTAMDPLRQLPVFVKLLAGFTNPFLGILAGFAITAILQSSSATTGLLIAVSASGIITIDMAFPIIFGQNIGTCVTAMLSSIGAGKAAKQAALMHLMFNVIGTVIFMAVLRYPVENIVVKLVPEAIQQQIAAAHILFNIINVVILFPFSGLIVKAAQTLIRSDEEEHEASLKYVDERLLATPPIAIAQASREVLRMGKKVGRELSMAVESFLSKDESLAHKVFDFEKKINLLARAILQFLVKLDKASLTDEEKDKLVILMNTLTDLERVGDHADNIAELALYKVENEVSFSAKASDEIDEMFKTARNVYEGCLNALQSADETVCRQVIEDDGSIDRMFKILRKNHIERLNEHVCEPNAGIIFLDAINNLERIGDHSSNIAISVLEILDKKNNKIL